MRVAEPSIFFLAASYNMSTFSVKNRETRKRRSYLLELSPHAKDPEHAKHLHVADARWIDTETGLSIDVYAVRYALGHPKGEGMLSCNDGSELMVRSRVCGPVREADRARIPTSSRCGRQLLKMWKPGFRTGTESFSSWSMGREHWIRQSRMSKFKISHSRLASANRVLTANILIRRKCSGL